VFDEALREVGSTLEYGG